MKTWKRYVCILLSLCLLLCLPAAEVSAASILKLDAKLTEKNVMKLLNKYDKNGAFILKETKRPGTSFLNWWIGGGRIVDGVDTAVHEQCHDYLGGFYGIRVFIGNKKSINVTYTDVYPSKKMASSIPKKLRTMRYSTYVAEPMEYLTSDVNGAYGLMNEFTAYSWGMNNTVSLYPYYAKFPATMDTWETFINHGANDRLAYAEFNYYILHYLYYAKKHYPKVYKGIINNKNFREAYRIIEKKFRSNIALYEKDLKKIVKKVKAAGGSAWYDEFFYIDGLGTGIFTADNQRLCKEIKKTKYQKIYKALLK